MEATIAQITREMEDARLTAEWCKSEREKLLEKQREAYRDFYQAKAKLKTLTENSYAGKN